MDDILPILKEGRWLTAQEALEYGFIDEIVEDGSKLNFDDAMKTRFNMFHLPALRDGGQDRKSGSRNRTQLVQQFREQIIQGTPAGYSTGTK